MLVVFTDYYQHTVYSLITGSTIDKLDLRDHHDHRLYRTCNTNVISYDHHFELLLLLRTQFRPL